MTRRRGQDDRGAAAVELALVLPILILLLGGIIDFGFAFNGQISLTHAAREGVRFEALQTGDPIDEAEKAFAAPGMGTPTAFRVQGCADDGSQAEIRVESAYDAFFLPFLNRTLEGEAVMRCGG